MIKKSSWQHLRIPFSFFLLPVFLFAASISPILDIGRFMLVFFILHFLLYPASNGYNSYFDKDDGSIGGLKNPPVVEHQLYYVSLIFDAVALMLGIFIGTEFVWMLLIYGFVSKAYSHPSIRLKKMPIVGWLAAGFFQGYFTFIMTVVGVFDIPIEDIWITVIQVPAMLSSVLLWGSYPMTQIYQHKEDTQRGDKTLSVLLGILGTFHFTAIMFSIATLGFLGYYLKVVGSGYWASAFTLVLSPMLIYFVWWYLKVRKDESEANFERTMLLNFLSSMILNVFFMVVLLDNNGLL